MVSGCTSEPVVNLMINLISHLERLTGPTLPGTPKVDIDRTGASQLYNLRLRRNRLFGAELFGEPAWDMLLDLYVHAAADRKVSISSACIASNVPATTALRWLNVLADRGLIEREPDPQDARRFYLKLTDRCDELMSQLF